ncbi:MAG: PAS domain S-box protein, partial [Saprospiraceae bacterium]|nr:PAS domain S-box protein [Saprospiraceae bacterium]
MQDLDRKSALLDILAKVKRWGVSTDQTEELASDIDALIEAESRPSFLDYDELNRYKSLVENNDLGIFSISRMHLSTVNQACVDILGFSEEELVSNGLDLFVYHEDLPKIGAMAQKVITGEIDSHYTEARFVHKNGSLRYFGVSLNAIRDSKGHYVESIGTFWDVTDKERAIL